MMKVICTFYEQCKKAVSENTSGGKPLTMAYIETNFGASLIKGISEMKREMPDPENEEAVVKKLDDLAKKIESDFRRVTMNQ